jgi:SAM-dependent methyltransferase
VTSPDHEGHHHQHHRSRDYDWTKDEADHFLKEASYEADLQYPPIALMIADTVPDGQPEPVVVDLGCGPALLLPEVVKELPRAKVVGIDPSLPMLKLARMVLDDAQSGTYELMIGKAEDIPMEDGSADVVVSLKNLHEWEDAPRGMTEVARILRPGGVFILRDSNKAYPLWKLRLLVTWRRMTKGRMAVKGYLGPYPDAYRPEEVDALLEGAGLRVLEADRESMELLYLTKKR